MKIRLISLLMVLALPCLVLAQNNSPHPLEGTWKLIKGKWGTMEEPVVQTRDIYKIFTNGHYFHVYYNAEKFSGAGGGTYTADDKTFTEIVTYFSWDSTIVGKTQVFNWTIEGNQLVQSGLINDGEKYNNYVVEEYWERVEDAISASKSPIAGVWQIEQSTYGNTTKKAEESRWRVNKIFTNKFWYAAFYDPKTGGFNGVGFGTYLLEGDQYTETLSAYSWDQSAVGKTFTFTMEIQPKTLVQKGKINSDKYKDYTIVEYFKRME